MPAARGVKRTASKSSAVTTSSSAPKNKKRRAAVVQLEVPVLPKRRGRVLTCGTGDVGQLGLGEDVLECTRFKFVSALGEKIVAVCAGGMHTVALDSDGKVWTFGCNDEGALGRESHDDEGVPKVVELPRQAVAVAAGDSHSAALLDDGSVYGWGAFRDSHGSMGLVAEGRTGKSRKAPSHINVGETVVSIASGGDHLVLLGVSGSVYTMGCGEQGQLGRLSQRSATRDTRQGFSALLVPAKVTLKCGISRIWAGYHATFALDSNGEKVYAWGLNNYGQLGIPGEKRKTAIFAPTACPVFTHGGWQSISCGQHHTVALDKDGVVFVLGRPEYGRLGLGDRSEDATNLEQVPLLKDSRCVSICAGTSSSFAVTDTGLVYSWGMGSEGQLGIGGSEDALVPTLAKIQDLCGISVSAGGQHTCVLAEDPSKVGTESPIPEEEEPEQKIEDKPAAKNDTEAKEKRSKRKLEQNAEVSSTSTVAEEDKPENVNGKDKKEIAMEVDQTDNAEKETPKDKSEDMQTNEQESKPSEEQPQEKPEEKAPEKPKTEEKTTPEKPTVQEEKSEEPPKMDIEPVAPKSVEPPKIEPAIPITENDVEMKEVKEAEVNGTPEITESAEIPVEKIPEDKVSASANDTAVVTA